MRIRISQSVDEIGDLLPGADVLITGEGRADAQSAMDKRAAAGNLREQVRQIFGLLRAFGIDGRGIFNSGKYRAASGNPGV